MSIPLEGFCDGFPPAMEFVSVEGVQIKVPTLQSLISSPVKIKVFTIQEIFKGMPLDTRRVECPYKNKQGTCKLRKEEEIGLGNCIWEDSLNNLRYLPKEVTPPFLLISAQMRTDKSWM